MERPFNGRHVHRVNQPPWLKYDPVQGFRVGRCSRVPFDTRYPGFLCLCVCIGVLFSYMNDSCDITAVVYASASSRVLHVKVKHCWKQWRGGPNRQGAGDVWVKSTQSGLPDWDRFPAQSGNHWLHQWFPTCRPRVSSGPLRYCRSIKK